MLIVPVGDAPLCPTAGTAVPRNGERTSGPGAVLNLASIV